MTTPPPFPLGQSGRLRFSPAGCFASIRAFSLTELLVVIAILTMLATLGGSAFEQFAQGSSVSKAAGLAAGLVEQARSTAVLDGANSRIAIDADPASEGYLRRMVVLVREKQTDGSVSWRVSTRPLTLPRGAYFYEEYSNPIGTMDVELPGGNTLCYYYEFDRHGRLVGNGSGDMMQIVFVSGIMEEGPSSRLTVPPRRELGREGFILRLAGNVTHFGTPDQIRKP